jgi:tetratricopeptide (TPR) repeat protein
MIIARFRVLFVLCVVALLAAACDEPGERSNGTATPAFTSGTPQTSILTREPSTADDFYQRAREWFRNEEYDLALNNYGEAIRLKPDFAEAYHGRGVVFIWGEYDYRRAIEDFNKALEINPEFAEAYRDRGLAYMYDGRYDRAREDLDRAIKLVPTDSLAYVHRGSTYLFKGKDVRDANYYKRALEDFEKAVELRSNYAQAYLGIGTGKWWLGDLAGAAEAYSTSIDLQSIDNGAYSARARVYNELKRYDEAISELTKILAMDPSDGSVYADLGTTYARQGDYTRAFELLDKGLREGSSNNHAYVYLVRGRVHLMRNEREEAVSAFREALKQDPDIIVRRDVEDELIKLGERP